MRSVHNYDILSNPSYSDRFHYIPCCYDRRADYVISEYKDEYMQVYSSDIVRLACDLAYMPQSQAKKLHFNEKYIFKHMCELRNNAKKQEKAAASN